MGNSTGTISLREAITAANNTTNDVSGPDEIHFGIGSGVQTIQPGSAFPEITDPVVIDATTQPGFVDSPIIELDGSLAAGPSVNGLVLVTNDSTVQGLVINRFSANGMAIGIGRTNNRVEGNFIGTDVSGTVDLGNGSRGILLGGDNNTIGGSTPAARNVISGHESEAGIGIGGLNNRIEGNYIGTGVNGTVAIANLLGIRVFSPGGNTTIVDNLISGSLSDGVSIENNSPGNNVVQGNFIGTDVTGAIAVPNGANGTGHGGVLINGSSNNIIGADPNAGGQGNVISGNLGYGVGIRNTADVGATGNVVAGNLIGTNVAGVAALGNGTNGVAIEFGASNNIIGGVGAALRNVISGNAQSGVLVSSPNNGDVFPTGNHVQGNYIGTDISGTIALGNGGLAAGFAGVQIINGASDNLIGGDASGAGNLISGNQGVGVQIHGAGTTGNRLEGNSIGLDASGATALGNTTEGVVILTSASGNTIGGLTAGAGNVISGNVRAGVRIDDADNNDVLGNLIGTDESGTIAVGNLVAGVDIGGGSSGNVIGGADTAARNVISGNGAGAAGVVFFGQATSNEVLGNYIGVDVSGLNPLPNLRGVLVETGLNNTIGAPGAGNLISSNTLHGVEILGDFSGSPTSSGNIVSSNQIVDNGQQGVTIGRGASDNSIVDNSITGNGANGVSVRTGPFDATGNSILGNSIFDNVSLGIDLGENGVTPNDAGDGDSGPNKLQNFPVLTSVSSTSVEGTLNSTLNTAFRIEIFANTVADLSGFGEGELFVGATTATTDGSGNVAFTTAVTTIPTGYFVTATATNPNDDTSEFSGQTEVTAEFNVVTVDTTADTLDGDASSIANLIINRGPDGLISLREAITAANNTPNLVGPDEIHFNIPADDPGHLYYQDDLVPGSLTRAKIAMTTEADDLLIAGIDPDWQHSWWSIQPFPQPSQPSGQLPSIFEPVTIRGFTQAGAQANTADIDEPIDAVLRIELDGENAVGFVNGLRVSGAGESTVQGLVINDFSNGVELASGGNFVVGNFIGTDVSGTLDVGNRELGVASGSTANTIGGSTTDARNLISGNDNVGIELRPGSSGHFIHGNIVGLDATGTKALGNSSRGIHVQGASDNIIGGAAKEFRNVVSGNGGGLSLGISLTVGATGNLIQGNFLGTDITGTFAIGNDSGVNVDSSSNNTIGGTSPGAGNLISGNSRGVIILANSNDNKIQGNFIGTDVTGTSSIANSSGIDIFSSANTIIGGMVAGAGNLISGNTNTGVSISNATSTGTKVEGNDIVGNGGHGVAIGSGASNNTIGGTAIGARNVISANGRSGVSISDTGTTGNVVEGNFIGLDVAGAADLGNGEEGVSIQNQASGNVIGGTAAGAGNVISGNTRAGVRIDAADTNLVQGNYIGTDLNGLLAIGNGVAGVDVGNGAQNNIIGGLTAAARNVISGNHGAAGVVFFSGATDNDVQGNYIGVDVNGVLPLANTSGILIETGINNTIGGTEVGAGNVISANTINGVSIFGNESTGNIVSGNYIGTDASETVDLGNGAFGVAIRSSASVNTIGGIEVSAGNVIAYNDAAGVVVGDDASDLATGNSILGNAIFDNGSLGIALGFNGVTPNDPGDADTGPNDFQNFPVLTVTSGTSVSGTLNSTPNTQFRIEIFANSAADPSGFGEGEIFVGATTATTDVSGNLSFTTAVDPIPAGYFVTATATNDVTGDTSEFSGPMSQPVTIDINASRINLNGNGVAPITLLNTGSFDPSTLDISTLQLGSLAGGASVDHFVFEDVDGDGDQDLILYF